MSQATTDAGRRSDARSWLVVLTHTVAVFGTVYVAAVVGPSLWLLPLWLWFGLALNGYLNLMHECAHSLTFRRRRTSERLARWVIAPLVLADFDGYRSRHLAHHKHLGSPRDTKDAYLVRIDGGRLAALVLRSLLLQEAVRKFRHQTPTAGEEPGAGVEFRGALADRRRANRLRRDRRARRGSRSWDRRASSAGGCARVRVRLRVWHGVAHRAGGDLPGGGRAPGRIAGLVARGEGGAPEPEGWTTRDPVLRLVRLRRPRHAPPQGGDPVLPVAGDHGCDGRR